MKKQDLTALVFNSIRDAKTIIDNYEYFKAQDNNELWQDKTKAEEYIESIYRYYAKDDLAINNIMDYITNYYAPYIEVFSKKDNRYMIIAQKIGGIVWKGAAFGFVLSCFEPNFFAPAILMFIAACSSYGYIRSMKRIRKEFLHEFKKLHNEAANIEKSELEKVLNENASAIKEKLALPYAFN